MVCNEKHACGIEASSVVCLMKFQLCHKLHYARGETNNVTDKRCLHGAIYDAIFGIDTATIDIREETLHGLVRYVKEQLVFARIEVELAHREAVVDLHDLQWLGMPRTVDGESFTILDCRLLEGWQVRWLKLDSHCALIGSLSQSQCCWCSRRILCRCGCWCSRECIELLLWCSCCCCCWCCTYRWKRCSDGGCGLWLGVRSSSSFLDKVHSARPISVLEVRLLFGVTSCAANMSAGWHVRGKQRRNGKHQDAMQNHHMSRQHWVANIRIRQNCVGLRNCFLCDGRRKGLTI
mmetsp:Transcript_12512/g.23604  ORF Transcript_12512/g.23604 Transcript_12512/m.23604 type:complete len:292 (-) Transcript_12512:33-908(-)